MFSRLLKPDEKALLVRMESFVRATTAGPLADPPQALEVVRLSVEIGKKVPEPVNPVVLIASSLLYQVGAGVLPSGEARGFLGASIVESFLLPTNLSQNDRVRIVQAISSVTNPGLCPPENIEERVVADAVQLESLGMIGVFRAVRALEGTLDAYIKAERPRRQKSFDGLFFEASRDLGRPIFRQGDVFLKTVEQAYLSCTSRLEDIALPV